MDHTGNNVIFERNYLSRMIRYDTQAAYLGNSSQADLIQAANQMSRWMDPRRPRHLNDEQRNAIRREKEVQKLRDHRDRLHGEIRERYGPMAKAVEEEIHNDYVAVKREVYSRVRARERAVLEQVQAEHDARAPVDDIQAQLGGDAEFARGAAPAPSQQQHVFAERARIAEAFFCDPSAFASESGQTRKLAILDDIIALCARRERRAPRTHRKRENGAGSQKRKRDLESLGSLTTAQPDAKFCKTKSCAEAQPTEEEEFPKLCEPFQCLFCIGNASLSLDERRRPFYNKYSLRRHVDTCPYGPPTPDSELACPHPHPDCVGVVLKNLNHFKNHAIRKHGIDL